MTDIREQIAEHKLNETNDMRKRTGTVKYNSKLVSFLYELIRDHLPAGVVEGLVHNSTFDPDVTYTNGYLAKYAQDIAARLNPFERDSIYKNGNWYEPPKPKATYAPWLGPSFFGDVYDKIKNNTLVDVYRCHELWCLVEQVCKLDKGSFIEVGVWRGGTGALIAVGSNYNFVSAPVYLCDTFKGVVKASDADSSYKGGEHADASVLDVQEVINKFLGRGEEGFNNVILLEGIFPEESSYRIPADEKFRLCHIDVDVYQSAKDITDWVWDRMVPGGIIVYDDYGFAACSGITNYVNDELMDKEGCVVMHNLNGHAVVIKL